MKRASLEDAVAAALQDVEVRRSRRRVRTVTAFREGGRIVVAIPARFTRTQEREWVRRMVTKLATQDQRRRPSDARLAERAAQLSARYLAGRAKPTSVAWSTNQGRRWGSCTPSEGTIRISTRVRGLPGWVLDYVLLHELAHLIRGGHDAEFWALLEAYPRTERARGFLEGFAFAAEADAGPDGALQPDDGPDGALEPDDVQDGALEPDDVQDGALEPDDVPDDDDDLDTDLEAHPGSGGGLEADSELDAAAQAEGVLFVDPPRSP